MVNSLTVAMDVNHEDQLANSSSCIHLNAVSCVSYRILLYYDTPLLHDIALISGWTYSSSLLLRSYLAYYTPIVICRFVRLVLLRYDAYTRFSDEISLRDEYDKEDVHDELLELAMRDERYTLNGTSVGSMVPVSQDGEVGLR